MSTNEDTNNSNGLKKSDDNVGSSFELVEKENVVILSNPVAHTLRNNRIGEIPDKRRYYQSQNKYQNQNNANPLQRSSEFQFVNNNGKRFVLPNIQTSRKFAQSNLQQEKEKNNVQSINSSLEQEQFGSIT